MATGSRFSLRWPSWRIRLNSGLEHLRSITNTALAQRTKLVRWGVLVAGGLALFFTVPLLWRALLMGAAGAALAFLLQELIDPSPLFWAVPWEATQFVLSRRVSVNHYWLHRTEELVHDSVGSSPRTDGFATREGFVLMGAGLNEADVQLASELGWRNLPNNR